MQVFKHYRTNCSNKKNKSPNPCTDHPPEFPRCSLFRNPTSDFWPAGKQCECVHRNDKGPYRRSNVTRVYEEALKSTTGSRHKSIVTYGDSHQNIPKALYKIYLSANLYEVDKRDLQQKG